MNTEIVEVMKQLKANRSRLTRQQFQTLKGQLLAGDHTGAIKGLRTILKKQRIKEERHEV